MSFEKVKPFIVVVGVIALIVIVVGSLTGWFSGSDGTPNEKGDDSIHTGGADVAVLTGKPVEGEEAAAETAAAAATAAEAAEAAAAAAAAAAEIETTYTPIAAQVQSFAQRHGLTADQAAALLTVTEGDENAARALLQDSRR